MMATEPLRAAMMPFAMLFAIDVDAACRYRMPLYRI